MYGNARGEQVKAVRIRKTLDSPIPGLPELTPMIGKTVEIIVIEETGAGLPFGYWESPTVDALRAAHGVEPVMSLDDLMGGWAEPIDDGFDEALSRWRHEEWQDAAR